ncbi:MAG: pyridoxamine 5'-phosphate oxidase family protein [Acidimicrobiales bacterium]|nr:pyridoxamine 5'-phosphate oxidase family protein [Acidimicrobiales bacterium]
MGSVDGRTWMEHLTDDECWSLLAQERVGRIAVVVEGRPEIFPVNHGVDERSIVFRTDFGAKLHGIARLAWVGFEVDGFDDGAQSGWSVLVKGQADEVVDPAAIERLDTLDVHFWGVGEKSHWLRIAPDEVTGRRIADETGSRSIQYTGSMARPDEPRN